MRMEVWIYRMTRIDDKKKFFGMREEPGEEIFCLELLMSTARRIRGKWAEMKREGKDQSKMIIAVHFDPPCRLEVRPHGIYICDSLEEDEIAKFTEELATFLIKLSSPTLLKTH
ncbi:hypothetical protein KJA15_02965 [Patescibacteria group bacterium]|nr:hypothetical protein [Patescibacteria group bacterium]